MFRAKKRFAYDMIHPRRRDRYQKPPYYFYKKYLVSCIRVCDRNCFVISSKNNSNKRIFYFHGGGYVGQIKQLHWQIVENILSKINCEIVVVDYPLYPEYSCIDTFNMVKEAYISINDKDDIKETILMGDSAGGGLALALAQYIKNENFKIQPSKIILLSPWLDVSMADNISDDRKADDLILEWDTLKMIGKGYAGDLGVYDYRCSPIYGDSSSIENVAIFTGTSDILNVQSKKFKDILNSNGQKVSYYEYKNMQHVWIAFSAPESNKALREIIDFIN